MNIEIPYNWRPRKYQYPLWNYLQNGGRRAVYVWHRRAGKDLFAMNFLLSEAVETVGTYWHIFPTYKQGKRAIWNETTLDGRSYLDFIPKELIASKNSTDMTITLKNGSIYQIVGGNDPDSLRGSGIKGAIFSEYAEQNPQNWLTVQPMLEASNGFALFNFTPKGQNHAYDLFINAKRNEDYFAQILTNDDTGVFTEQSLVRIKQDYMDLGYPEDFFNQEYFCSFTGNIFGSYYSKYLLKAEEEGRITSVKYDTNLTVNTAWDLGRTRDAMAIWFYQKYGNEYRFIDYYENTGEALSYYINLMKEKGYNYAQHYAPHDIQVTELTQEKSRIEIAKDLGVNFEVAPKLAIADGINSVRAVLNRCWFDKDNCAKGLKLLREYQKIWDDTNKIFRDHPKHNWASNCADAFRTFAVGDKEEATIDMSLLKKQYGHVPL